MQSSVSLVVIYEGVYHDIFLMGGGWLCSTVSQVKKTKIEMHVSSGQNLEKKLKEQACFIACPANCAARNLQTVCPKCLLVLWMSKHKLTIVPQTK